MKRFVLAALISIALHIFVIFILTGAEITHPAPGSVPGVTRATFVSINSGPVTEKPAEKKAGKKITQPQEAEKKEKIADIPIKTPEPVKKPVPIKKPDPVKKTTPEKKPVEKKKEPPVKRAAPKPGKQDKNPPVEAEQNTEGQPGETSDKSQGTQENLSDSTSGEVNPNPDTEAVSKNINRIHDIAEGDITRRVPPVYPRASRLRREEGQVVIVTEIKNGKAVKVSIESSSGHQRLDRAALEAVKKWEFGFMGERTVRIPVIFRLRN